MISHFNNQSKVTIYRYSIYSLYIVTILYLLIGRYTRLLYCVFGSYKGLRHVFTFFRNSPISLISKSFAYCRKELIIKPDKCS